MKWRIHMTLVIHNQQIVDEQDLDRSIERMKDSFIESIKYGKVKDIKENMTYHMFPWES